MNNFKSWYESKAVWGSLITLASMAAAAAGHPVAGADQQTLAELATTMAATLGAILSLFGRLSAKDRIR